MQRGGEGFSNFAIIAAGGAFQDRGHLHVNVDLPITFNGELWAYTARPLAVPYSLHTALTQHDDKGNRYDLWLDWHDLETNPGTARSLIYVSADRNVSLEEKLTGVEKLAQSVQVYNSFMIDYEPNSSKTELENLLASGKLPRPQAVQLVWSASDGGLGLNYVAKKLGLEETTAHAFIVSWKQLLKLCTSGELVETWKKLVSTGLGTEIMFDEPEIIDPDKPEVFYKDDLCLALTGHTSTELRDIACKNIVNPTDRDTSAIGRDAPRSESEKFTDRFIIFMRTEFVVPLLGISVDKLFEVANRFRRFEQYIHSGEGYRSWRERYDPIYERIRKGYLENNEVELKTAIMELIDKVLHD